MAIQPSRQYMTPEQYLLLVNNSDRHYEYYDGEVLLRSTEVTDRFVKLALYQAKESIQEIIFISQIIQRVEVFSRSTTGWLYHQYGAGQSILLTGLDIEIEVRQLYRYLSIPAVVEEVEGALALCRTIMSHSYLAASRFVRKNDFT